jgi:hypothetical protein
MTDRPPMPKETVATTSANWLPKNCANSTAHCSLPLGFRTENDNQARQRKAKRCELIALLGKFTVRKILFAQRNDEIAHPS